MQNQEYSPTRKASVAIVGGGLAGLYSAFLLEQRGITDYLVLEARSSIGGRTASVQADLAPHPADNRFDLGAAWYWPSMQPRLATLIDELGLHQFPQFEDGDTLLDRSNSEAPSRFAGFKMVPASMRISGGMASIAEALRKRIQGEVLTRSKVERIQSQGEKTVLTVMEGSAEFTIVADAVLLAVPPRIAATTIQFEPPLPSDIFTEWKETGTWMAPHAKYVAVYDEPFWRESALSGSARSFVGPMGEIHDASNPEGDAALFGFIAIGGFQRKSIPEVALKEMCRDQLTRLFGDRAASPKSELLKDWTQDRFTATDDDLQPQLEHPHPPRNTAQTGPWASRVLGVGSEWSREFPGYVAGAIEAAESGIQQLMNRQSHSRSQRHGRQ